MTDHCIASVQAHTWTFSYFIIFSYLGYLKHEMNIITYFISTVERRQYTSFIKFKSTEANLLSCLICLLLYDWSDRLSIKLFANSQLGWFCFADLATLFPSHQTRNYALYVWISHAQSVTAAYTLKNQGALRCHRRTFLSKWFHKEPLTSEEPFCFTKGYLWWKKVLQIIKR